MSTTLRTVTAVALCNPPLPVVGEFVWDSDIPAEIRLTMTIDQAWADLQHHHDVATSITWHFARRLVEEATANPGDTVGDGDIALWCESADTSPSRVYGLRLTLDDDTTTTAIVEYEPLRWLLARSFEIQPNETDLAERLDAELLALIEAER